MKTFFAAFLLLAVTPILASEIAEGTYVTKGATRYQDGALTFSRWGEEFIMKAGLVQGPHIFPVTITFRAGGENEFIGAGKVLVRYPDGTGCYHKIGARVYAYPDRLYFKENTPQTIPYNPYGGCEAAGPYVWYSHPEPYLK